jgi:hypothetical protein
VNLFLKVSNLDLLVVGAYYGDGRRRAGLLSHFLLAVADHTTMRDDGTAPTDVNATKWWSLIFHLAGFLCLILSHIFVGDSVVAGAVVLFLFRLPAFSLSLSRRLGSTRCVSA